MSKVLSIIFLVVTCSAFYFPINFWAFPMVNTKMLLAAIGLVIFIFTRLQRRTFGFKPDLFWVLILGLGVSLWSYATTTYNLTVDYVYVTYFVSMAVWLGGAYCVISLMRKVHGEVSLKLVLHYMALMCALQCVIALLMDNIPIFKEFIDSIVVADVEKLTESNRLYGIGASFDTAGIRFSCVLLGISYLFHNEQRRNYMTLYILLYLIIVVVGNMMSRTTIVGVAISIVYLVIVNHYNKAITFKGIKYFVGISLLLLLFCGVIVHLYQTNAEVRSLLRYGFEGFFNFFEYGTWETTSSNLLFNGLNVLPTNSKTWLIGDGFFADPTNPGIFYMGIDMGYLRYIYYFGLVGLSLFILYFIVSSYVIYNRNTKLALFVFLLFVIQLVVWVKIPTDIFAFYALLLLLTPNETASSKEIIIH